MQDSNNPRFIKQRKKDIKRKMLRKQYCRAKEDTKKLKRSIRKTQKQIFVEKSYRKIERKYYRISAGRQNLTGYTGTVSGTFTVTKSSGDTPRY